MPYYVKIQKGSKGEILKNGQTLPHFLRTNKSWERKWLAIMRKLLILIKDILQKGENVGAYFQSTKGPKR
jgi:hypothetical protein